MTTMKPDEMTCEQKDVALAAAYAIAIRWGDDETLTTHGQRLRQAFRLPSLLPTDEETHAVYMKHARNNRSEEEVARGERAIGALYITACKRAISGEETITWAVNRLCQLEDELAGTEFGR